MLRVRPEQLDLELIGSSLSDDQICEMGDADRVPLERTSKLPEENRVWESAKLCDITLVCQYHYSKDVMRVQFW